MCSRKEHGDDPGINSSIASLKKSPLVTSIKIKHEKKMVCLENLVYFCYLLDEDTIEDVQGAQHFCASVSAL